MKRIYIVLFLFLIPTFLFAKEDVTKIYEKVTLNKDVVAVSSYNEVHDVEYLLVETTNIEDGKYKVEVTRVDDHIYKIEGTDLFIKMPYCYEYSYRDEAILEIFSGYGVTCAELTWMRDY